MKNNAFIVTTANFLTKKIACTALKAADTNETAHRLLQKACMNKGKIVISSVDELKVWREALNSYAPKSKAESEILRVLKSAATRGINNRASASAVE